MGDEKFNIARFEADQGTNKRDYRHCTQKKSMAEKPSKTNLGRLEKFLDMWRLE